MSHLHSLPHYAVPPSQFQQHIHRLGSSLSPECPQTPTQCLSSSSSAPALVTSPLFLLPRGQMGQGSPWLQAVFPPGPTKSAGSCFCARVLLPSAACRDRAPQVPRAGGRLKPRHWERGWGQGRGYLRGVPHLQREHGTAQHCQHGRLTALPCSPFFGPGPSDTELQGWGLQAASSWGGVTVMGLSPQQQGSDKRGKC